MKNKSLMTILIVLCFLLALPLTAASASLEVHYENYTMQDGDLLIFVNSSGSDDIQDKLEFSVTLGGAEIHVKSVETVLRSGVGISYMLLADISGSMTSSGMEQVR